MKSSLQATNQGRHVISRTQSTIVDSSRSKPILYSTRPYSLTNYESIYGMNYQGQSTQSSFNHIMLMINHPDFISFRIT
jgi:hypothetical protein